MNKELLIKELEEDEKIENGEIVERKEEGILYYDYDMGEEIFYRFGEFCTTKHLEEITHVGAIAQNHGLTAQYITEMLKEAYNEGTEFEDMMCTLRGIYVISSEEEFVAAVKEVLETTDDTDSLKDYLNDAFSYDDFEHLCGKTWYEKQTAFINEKCIWELADELTDEFSSFENEYCIGISTTTIHECRHLMLDTNPFLPENTYPIEESSEASVEEFCRIRSERLQKYKTFNVIISTKNSKE